MFDISYKQALMRGMGENPDEYGKLDAIAGKEEFLAFLNYAADKPALYTGETNDFFNTKNAIFQANFHIHTVNSDGMMTVPEFLDLGARYADKFAARHKGEKVYLALTDHDTVNGPKQALKLLLQNPQKYQNLRVILGVEMSTTFSSPYMSHPRDAHLLHYCLNPFDHPVTELNEQRLKLLYTDIEQALDGAREKYRYVNQRYGIEYNIDEIIKMRPQLKLFPHDARLTLKDYMQFKLLFADLVEKNPSVAKILQQAGVSAEELDFTVPKFMLGHTTKRPYWANYVDTTQEYLESLLKEKNPQINLNAFREAYGKISPELMEPLGTMEYVILDPASPLYIKYDAKPVEFEAVVKAFGEKDYTVSGIAHPAFTLRNEKENPQKVQLVHDFIGRFQQLLGQEDMTIERHYPYSQDVGKEWANLVYTAADHYKHIPSGGRDSHRNNFFSRDIWLTDEQLAELTRPATPNYQAQLLGKMDRGR